MASPKTSSKTTRKHITKEEKAIRVTMEDTLKGAELPSEPPESFNDRQKEIYRFLYNELAPAEVLGTIDIFAIRNACVIIERLEELDKLTAEDITDRNLALIRNSYFAQFLKIIGELCLSPAARAKMGVLAVNAHHAKKDALMNALGDGVFNA